jgi:hypothetical protein
VATFKQNARLLQVVLSSIFAAALVMSCGDSFTSDSSSDAGKDAGGASGSSGSAGHSTGGTGADSSGGSGAVGTGGSPGGASGSGTGGSLGTGGATGGTSGGVGGSGGTTGGTGGASGGVGGTTGGAGGTTGGTGGADCAKSGEACSDKPCCANLYCCTGISPYQLPGTGGLTGFGVCQTLCPISDRNLKQGLQSVDPNDVLERVSRLPISTWSYKAEQPSVRHIGPMAQDFMATFGVGSSDRTIQQVDADGVALTAIQALLARVERLEIENRELRRAVEALRVESAGSAAHAASKP